MKSRYFIAWIILLLVVGIQGCGGNAAQTEGIAEGNILFQDDFSQKGSWDEGEDEDGKTAYQENGYLIMVKAANTNIWANPGINAGDVQVEVNATKIAGQEDNEFGIICRYQDTMNFYYFAITSDGYFGIFKVKEGKNILINRTEWMPSEEINKEAKTNQIRADCVDSTLSLYVNGKLLDQQEDADFKAGDVGLIAGSNAQGGTEIIFDDFLVKRPQP